MPEKTQKVAMFERHALVFAELTKESDRGAAIVGGAYLDDHISETIRAYLHINEKIYNELLNPNNITAPLSSFGARIIAAQALGIIEEKDRKLITKIKSIRNRFAHDFFCTFEGSPISEYCDEIRKLLPSEHHDQLNSPRQVYIFAIVYLIGLFDGLTQVIEDMPLSGKFKDVMRGNMKTNQQRSEDKQ
jgi:hypothetical protein